jgi:hypothetical protein
MFQCINLGRNFSGLGDSNVGFFGRIMTCTLDGNHTGTLSDDVGITFLIFGSGCDPSKYSKISILYKKNNNHINMYSTSVSTLVKYNNNYYYQDWVAQMSIKF